MRGPPFTLVAFFLVRSPARGAGIASDGATPPRRPLGLRPRGAHLRHVIRVVGPRMERIGVHRRLVVVAGLHISRRRAVCRLHCRVSAGHWRVHQTSEAVEGCLKPSKPVESSFAVSFSVSNSFHHSSRPRRYKFSPAVSEGIKGAPDAPLSVTSFCARKSKDTAHRLLRRRLHGPHVLTHLTSTAPLSTAHAPHGPLRIAL